MQAFAWLIWDLAAVFVVVLCIRTGVRRGFLRMVISFACYILSAWIAQRFSMPIAETIYTGSIEAPLRLSIIQRLEEALIQGVDLSAITSGLPGWMQAIAAAFSDPEVLQSLNLNESVERIADIVVDQVLREGILWLLQGLLFLTIFTVLAWVIQRIARLFSGIYRIPVIGTVNSVLGGLLGVLQAVVLLIVASVVVQMLIALTGGNTWMNAGSIEEGYIFRVFYGQILPAFGAVFLGIRS